MRRRKAGFTGTRKGTTPHQRNALVWITEILEPTEVHHGDCQGADEEMHWLASSFLRVPVVRHPPADPKLRAFCSGGDTRPPKDYLTRDRDIVDETEYLIATPDSRLASRGSGTWYTVDYARRLSRPVVLVLPDGTVEIERMGTVA